MRYSASTWTLLLCLFFGYHASSHASSAPTLSSDTDIATAGYYQLSWDTDYPKVELQEALDSTFAEATSTSIYIGSDRASLLSGKSNATYYYRIRGIDADNFSDWSQPVKVKVAHHSLGRAFSILGLGFVIFMALVVVILRGEGKHA